VTSRDNPPITPVMDSWRNYSSAASWLWTPRSRPEGDDAPTLNAWGAEQLSQFLEALRPFARIRTAFFGGPPESRPLPVPEHTWDERESSHAGFERMLIHALRTASIPITVVELSFDLDVWVRTQEGSPPARGWVRGLMRGELMLEMENPYGAVMMNHTLFLGGSFHGRSNADLHRLNAPMLATALKTIEARLGPITEVEGLDEVTRTGFKPMG
jgi:hypothetical protein